MDRLAAMDTFVRVAEAGSFTAVADQLNLARSAVTRQIAALEAHLGVKLIARSTRRLSLTQEGSTYLAQCREILDQINRVEAGLVHERTAAHGLIRATVPMSFAIRHLMPLVAQYALRNEQVSIDLDVSDRRVDLVEEGFDLGIRITNVLPDSQVARRICTSRIIVVASAGYLAARGEPTHPAQLRNHDCLTYSLAQRSGWQFVIDGQLQTFEVGGRISANSGDAIQVAAINGLGIACQPSFLAAEAVRTGQLVRLMRNFTLPEIAIYAVFPGNRFVPQRVRNFVDFLAEKLTAGSKTGDLPYWDRDI